MAHIDTPRTMGDMDAPHRSPITPSEDIRTIAINQISWSAVFAGVVTALAVHVILNLLGLGIGAATVDARSGDTPDAQTFSMGAGLWWTISGIIASLAGGYVAGRTSGKPKESTAGLHGFASWATTTLVIFYMITTSAGTLIGGLYSTVSGVVEQHAGQAAQTAANTPDPMGQLKGQVQQMTGQDPNNPSPEAKQRAADTANATATAISTGGIFAAIALLLGGVAGFFGGRMGAVDPTVTSSRLARTER